MRIGGQVRLTCHAGPTHNSQEEETRSSVFINDAREVRNVADAEADKGASNAKLKREEATAKGVVLIGDATAKAFSTRTNAAIEATMEVKEGLELTKAQVSKLMYYDAIHASKDTVSSINGESSSPHLPRNHRRAACTAPRRRRRAPSPRDPSLAR